VSQSESSSRSFYAVPNCKCGISSKFNAAKTHENPNRHFFGYSYFKVFHFVVYVIKYTHHLIIVTIIKSHLQFYCCNRSGGGQVEFYVFCKRPVWFAQYLWPRTNLLFIFVTMSLCLLLNVFNAISSFDNTCNHLIGDL